MNLCLVQTHAEPLLSHHNVSFNSSYSQRSGLTPYGELYRELGLVERSPSLHTPRCRLGYKRRSYIQLSVLTRLCLQHPELREGVTVDRYQCVRDNIRTGREQIHVNNKQAARIYS